MESLDSWPIAQNTNKTTTIGSSARSTTRTQRRRGTGSSGLNRSGAEEAGAVNRSISVSTARSFRNRLTSFTRIRTMR